MGIESEESFQTPKGGYESALTVTKYIARTISSLGLQSDFPVEVFLNQRQGSTKTFLDVLTENSKNMEGALNASYVRMAISQELVKSAILASKNSNKAGLEVLNLGSGLTSQSIHIHKFAEQNSIPANITNYDQVEVLQHQTAAMYATGNGHYLNDANQQGAITSMPGDFSKEGWEKEIKPQNIILAQGILMYMPVDIQIEMLRKMSDRLLPGGVIIFDTVNSQAWDGLPKALQMIFNSFAGKFKGSVKSKEEMESRIKQVGDLSIEKIGSQVDLANGMGIKVPTANTSFIASLKKVEEK